MTKWTPNPRGNYYERKAYREQRAPEIAAEKARKEAKSMHCQCCGRAIFAQTGSIAHHGYERPGTGWQTPSCVGAKELPWEVSRAALDKLIVMLGHQIDGVKAHIKALRAEKAKVPYCYATYEKSPTADRYASPTRVNHTEMFDRASFDAIVGPLRERMAALLHADDGTDGYRDARGALSALERALWDGSSSVTFDVLKDAEIGNHAGKLAQLKQFKTECEERFAGWKQTHSHFDKATGKWIAL